jgi:hypothetical protein
MRGHVAIVLMLGLAGTAAPAAAQTAAQINRMNQAVQICNSPGGAAIPECAQLNARLGLPAPGGFAATAPVGTGGLGGGGTTAGILGALNAAMASRPSTPPTPVAPAVSSQGVAACVRQAAGDTTAIQTCLTTASAPRAPAPTLGGPGPGAPYRVPSLGQPILPSAGPNVGGGGAALGIHQAGQSYQGCVAANPDNWRSCLPLLNGGAPPR